MKVQRKKRSQDHSHSPVAAERSSLFASPELDMAPAETALSDTTTKDTTTLDVRRQQASQSSYDFGRVSLLANEGTVQRSASPLIVQREMTVGAAGDQYEQEADRVAVQVVDQINRPEAHQSDQTGMRQQPGSEDTVQRTGDDDDEVQTKPMVQTVGLAGGPVPQGVEAAIQSEKGKGHTLEPTLQGKVEQAMGTDLSNVKIHTDAKSDQLNRAIQAKAFTTGNDVFFRQGAYQPNSRSGQALIVHEITHREQQTGHGVQRSQYPSQTTIQRELLIGTQSVSPEAGLEIMKQNYPAVVQEYGQMIPKLLALYDSEGRTFETNAAMKEAIVDDASSGEEQLVEAMEGLGTLDTFQWGGQGLTGFLRWMRGDHDNEDALVGANCWTAVLYAAYRAGIVDKPYMVRAHEEDKSATEGSTLTNAIARNPTGKVVHGDRSFEDYEEKATWYLEQINQKGGVPRGKVITIGSHGAHVMLSKGGGSVMELNKQPRDFESPNPNYDKNWKTTAAQLFQKISSLKHELAQAEATVEDLANKRKTADAADKPEATRAWVQARKGLQPLKKKLRELEKQLVAFKGQIKVFGGAQDGKDVQYFMTIRPNEIASKTLREVLLGQLMYNVQFDGIYWGPLPLV